jgi:low affinity Fe/Cu permease
MDANNSSVETFRYVARAVADKSGSAWVFLLALTLVIVWGGSGPFFKFSDTWQLVINTMSSIVTFLMVFLIQSTQNRDTREIHIKLDELIRVNEKARNIFMDLDRFSDDDLTELERALAASRKNRSTVGAAIQQGKSDP